MKVCIFGCKSTTLLLARHVKDILGLDAIVSIDAQKSAKAEVADYTDVRPWAKSQDVPVYHATRYDLKSDNDLAFFEKECFDVGLVMGWQRLVPEPILDLFSTGVFGMHGSSADLPRGRGRSPMNWALIEGRKLFYTNLFKYDKGIDSGEILDQVAFSINDADTAETMHFKNTMGMVRIIRRNAEAFRSGSFAMRPQSDLEPTFYPKRTPDDSLIDWSTPIDCVERFIRAVAPPFNGAFTFLNGARLRITRAVIFDFDCVSYGFDAANFGEIVEVFPNGKFLVKCIGGLLLIHDHDGAAATVLVPGALLHNGLMTKQNFPVNAYGGFDLPDTKQENA